MAAKHRLANKLAIHNNTTLKVLYWIFIGFVLFELAQKLLVVFAISKESLAFGITFGIFASTLTIIALITALRYSSWGFYLILFMSLQTLGKLTSVDILSVISVIIYTGLPITILVLLNKEKKLLQNTTPPTPNAPISTV